MGAFDGYWIPGGRRIGEVHIVASGTQPRKQYLWFSNQSSFEFFNGFEMPELKALLAEAERDGDNTVWVPQERPGEGRKGLKTWYVRALIKEYDHE
jgi:hypothetical protein